MPPAAPRPAANPNRRRATGVRQAAPTQSMNARRTSQNIPNRRSLRHQDSPLQARDLPARLHELALQSDGCPTLRGSIRTQVGAQANQLENTGHDIVSAADRYTVAWVSRKPGDLVLQISSPGLRSGTRVHPQAGLHSSSPRHRRLGIVILVAVHSRYMPTLGILSRACRGYEPLRIPRGSQNIRFWYPRQDTVTFIRESGLRRVGDSLSRRGVRPGGRDLVHRPLAAMAVVGSAHTRHGASL
ncbi:hypothetical protein MTO96_052203 [Rhipicephalus appendiculatus]